MPDFAAQPAGCIRLERLLAGEAGSRQEVLAAVQALGDAELVAFGLRAYQLNLLSLFGESWSRDRIARTARAAAISKLIGGWEYHHDYLPRLTEVPDAAQVEDFPLALISEMLARGRGLAIVTFHLGPMRYLPSDLAHAGIATCIPLAGDSFNDYRTARMANPDAALWQHLRIVNAEERGGALALARTLATGGCVMSTIDGNTGLDGPRGDQRRALVRILRTTARVKTGLIGLAARFGSPILVLTAHSEGERRFCRTGPVTDPGRALAGEEGERFTEAAVRQAYAFFGAALEVHADEWCGGDLFHQWRVPRDTPRRDLAETERMLAHSLATGGPLAINHRRIVPLGGADLVWSDALSGQCYKLPAEMAGLVEQLAAPGGVSRGWLDRHAAAGRSLMWALLCQLASRDAIHAIESATTDKPRPRNTRAIREIARPLMHGTGM